MCIRDSSNTSHTKSHVSLTIYRLLDSVRSSSNSSTPMACNMFYHEFAIGASTGLLSMYSVSLSWRSSVWIFVIPVALAIKFIAQVLIVSFASQRCYAVKEERVVHIRFFFLKRKRKQQRKKLLLLVVVSQTWFQRTYQAAAFRDRRHP